MHYRCTPLTSYTANKTDYYHHHHHHQFKAPHPQNQDKVSSSTAPNPQNQSNLCQKKDFFQGVHCNGLINSINMIL